MTAEPFNEPAGAARVGIGGPVGSGKTALLEQMIPRLLKRDIALAVITNDLVTQEDAERLRRANLIEPGRVVAVEAGACPHTVIREDPTLNLRGDMRYRPSSSSLASSSPIRSSRVSDISRPPRPCEPQLLGQAQLLPPVETGVGH